MNEEVATASPLLSQEEIRSMIEERKPSPQRALREYEVNLRFLSKGMIIRVGCKEIAFSDNKEGIEALTKYLESPQEEQDRWYKLLND